MRDLFSGPSELPHSAATVPRLLVSAAHKSSGKTTVSIGLCAALRARGLRVASFKKGPDYIDPLWLARASGRSCYNLDPYLMPESAMVALFGRKSQASDIAIVEGNKGLYDGVALDGSNSNAAVASTLDLPVLLVVDARGMTRGIAPLILGYQAFDRRIRIAGVIFNRVGGTRHEAKLRAVVAHYTDVPVLGSLREDESIAMVERHLGLMPDNEAEDADALVARIAHAVAMQIDLDQVLSTACEAVRPSQVPTESATRALAQSLTQATPALPTTTNGVSVPARTGAQRLRVGIAMDRAFGFYYRDDLEALCAAGAELVPLDTLRDRRLPAVDALFIGGGFPESCAADLQANASLRDQILIAIQSGLPTYAECGGLMYLARSLEVAGKRFTMVGAIPADVRMHARPVGRGYVELQPTAAAPFALASGNAATIRAHEFHYSSLSDLPKSTRFAYRVLRGHGIDGSHDGIVIGNLLASYSHLRTGAGSQWATRFVQFARQVTDRKRTSARIFEDVIERSLVP